MLERKRKQTMSFDISEQPVNHQLKKKRCSEISKYTPGDFSMTKNIYNPPNDMDYSANSIHQLQKIKASGDGYMGMDVDEDGDGSFPSRQSQVAPRCARCAAGQGGHISHLLS